METTMASNLSNVTESSGDNKSSGDAVLVGGIIVIFLAIVATIWGFFACFCGGFGFGISFCLRHLYQGMSRDDLWKTLTCLGVADMVLGILWIALGPMAVLEMQKSFSREYERSTKLSIEMAVATVYTASVEVISGLFLVIVSLKKAEKWLKGWKILFWISLVCPLGLLAGVAIYQTIRELTSFRFHEQLQLQNQQAILVAQQSQNLIQISDQKPNPPTVLAADGGVQTN